MKTKPSSVRKPNVKIQIYKARKGEWRCASSASGRIIADSGEGYKRKAAAGRTVGNLIAALSEGYFEFI